MPCKSSYSFAFNAILPFYKETVSGSCVTGPPNSENHSDFPSATSQRAGVRAKLHLSIKPGLAHQHLFDFTAERGRLGKDCEPLQPHSTCLNPPAYNSTQPLHSATVNIKQLERKISPSKKTPKKQQTTKTQTT